MQKFYLNFDSYGSSVECMVPCRFKNDKNIKWKLLYWYFVHMKQDMQF